MKLHLKSFKSLAAIGLILGFSQVSASALTITIDRVDGYFGGVGGEFTVTGTGLNSYYNSLAKVQNRFGVEGVETFCLEYGEHVSIPATYNASIGIGATSGGPDHSDFPNPSNGIDYLSVGTALLYSQFASGTLSQYYYDSSHAGTGVFGDRSAAATALQNAIWMLEDEVPYTDGNKFLISLGITAANWGTAYGLAIRDNNTDMSMGVRVLNLGDSNLNFPNQDQLVLDRSSYSVPSVPDGGSTAMLLGTVFSGLAFLKRRLS